MINEVADSRLHHYLQKIIHQSSPEIYMQLRGIVNCNTALINLTTSRSFMPGVFLLSNGKRAEFFGLQHCGNTWYCPECAPRQMAKHATNIAAAIDAIEYYENQVPFMLTLTFPHTRTMSFDDCMHILYQSWKNFIVRGNKPENIKRHNCNDVFANFCKAFNCRHRVRVCEVTYGEAGWHPHFHCLFWVDKDKLQLVRGWQQSIQERWLTLCKRNTLKLWDKKNPNHENNATRLRIMYERLNTESKAAYISVDQNNQVIQQKSSNYLCGWAADREVTGNVSNKASHENHYSMHDLLESAANGNLQHQALYLEYCLTIHRHKYRRINYSKASGIRQMIAKWKQTNQYKSFLKKKSQQEPPMKVVYWLSKQQWLILSWLNHKAPVIHNLLYLATLDNARQKINYYLELLNVETTIYTPEINSLIVETEAFLIA